jgi:hypothetical protein
MGGCSLLTGRDIGVLAAYFPPAFPAIPHLYCVTPHFRPRLSRNICDRYHFPLQPSQFSTAVWAARCGDRYRNRFRSQRLLRCIPESEKTLAGLAPWWFWIGFVRSSGKRRCSASAFQLLDFGPKLLDHPVLIQNDLNQLLAAE